MVDSQEIFSALQQLYEKEGTQAHLAELAGITQSTICAYLKGKAKVENMPVGVFLRLFRDMKIDYFGNEVKAQEDAVQKELLAIYNKLDIAGKTRLLALAAANFGEELRKNTKK